jgi:hypothetical protein
MLGWRGGNDEYSLYWHPKERFWAAFSEGDFGGYWCPYGTADPNENCTVSITCEINPPADGVNRRKGGVFLRDSTGTLFLGHTGKLAGGRKGIGKSSFLEQYSGRHRAEVGRRARTRCRAPGICPPKRFAGRKALLKKKTSLALQIMDQSRNESLRFTGHRSQERCQQG